MRPRPVTHDDLQLRGGDRLAVVVTFGPPAGHDEIQSVDVVATTARMDDGTLAAVLEIPWQPDEADLAHLAQGGTLWLTLYAENMPPVAMAVQPKEES